MAATDETLLKEWRDSRDPRLAETMVQQLALKVRRAPRTDDVEQAWARAVEQRNFGELLSLLLCGTLGRVEERVRALADWDDPRVGGVLRPVLVALGEQGREELLPVVIEVLGRSRDVGNVWYLEQWEEEEPDRVAAALKELEQVKVRPLKNLGAVVKAAPKREADLLEAIYSAPADDAPRAVYADALLERADPRGEFIALQLSPDAGSVAKRRQAAALVSRHFRDWCFPLTLNQSSTQLSKVEAFSRGFLSAAVVDRLAGQQQLREWATVEHLYADRMYENQPALRTVAKSSKVLRSLFWLDLDSVAQLKSDRLERVGVWCSGDLQRKHLAGLSGLRGLWLIPSLKFKKATVPWKGLEQLCVYDSGPGWDDWRADALAHRTAALKHMSFLDSQAWMPHVKGWELRFRLELDPEMKRPEFIWHGGRQLARALDGFTPAFCRRLESVIVRAPTAMIDRRLKDLLGKKMVMGKALTKRLLDADPLVRLISD